MAAPPLAFRRLAADADPAPGELWLQAAAEHGDCRALALLVLDHGPGALRRGGAAVETLVAGPDPTLDDLLAAHLVSKQLASEPVAEGFRGLAHYAAAVREGVRPAPTIPVEDSLEGVFLHVRTEAGRKETNHSLADREAARAFLAGWADVARRLDRAAADPSFDPFIASPLAGASEFARARGILRDDRQLYRDDVARGRRFRARLPEDGDCAALLLREPKSLLFRYWFREDADAPGGRGYRLLLVDWGHGEWVISTDPAKKISLQALAERLQAAEPNPPGPPPAGRWFDGKPFRHTLIAAPRGGTKLTEAQLLKVVRGWAALAPAADAAAPAGRAKRGLSAVAAALVPVLLGAALWRGTEAVRSEEWGVRSEDHSASSLPPPHSSVRSPPAAHAVAATLRQGQLAEAVTLSIHNPGPATRPIQFNVAVRAEVPPAGVHQLAVTGPDGVERFVGLTADEKDENERRSQPLELELPPGDTAVKVVLKHDGRRDLPVTVRPSWPANPADADTLHVLAFGVSEYANPKNRPLPCARGDAVDLASALERHAPGLFSRVRKAVWTDREATHTRVESELKRLEAEVRDTDVVVLALSGHGARSDHKGRPLYFLPHDCDPALLRDRGLDWRHVFESLDLLPCRVLVVLDCCHSGAVVRGTRGQLDRELQQAAEQLRRSKKGMMLLAACQADETAEEREKEWGHGALTLALLEYLEGRSLAKGGPQPLGLPGGDRVVYLDGLCKYAAERVDQLTGSGQAVVYRPTENLAPQHFPIAVVRTGR